MFTIQDLERPHLGKVVTTSLKEAIRVKNAWLINQNAHAIILDDDGYVVSTREIAAYLAE